MKKSRQYIAGLLLLFIMALASGCGDGRDSAKSTEGTKQSQSAASAQSTENGMENGPTNAGSSMADDMDMGNEESTGVLDGLADDVREGMDDIRDAAEGSIGASGEISPR
ncbi:hypothetical protein [Otoolea muris]|uniref:hypothetical protein n=1 Tax=Otoolea muris TaxID=2941515 RepID=UPI00203EB76C|nr:hypothetical protein [Otoolea muris]